MYKVFLSAGHGGKDAGAVANGLREKDINLHTLLACKEELEKYGVKVFCSRTIDADDTVYDEVREANASKANIAVSFHANAGKGDGFEAFYYTTNSKGKQLAQLTEKYIKELGQNSRGIKSGNHLYFVRKTTMPAILVESFFLDNATDKAIGDTVAEQRAFGVAYAKAILEYFGIKKPVAATTTITANKTSDLTKVAKEVIKGLWGNGEERKQKLAAAGYDYKTIQAEVNKILLKK